MEGEQDVVVWFVVVWLEGKECQLDVKKC